ncbi:GSCOCG00006760001-RA-CDS [Cotesia congregata]|nr:GSCOCG00006760001-RA-CDS [Cotesia congregata]
MYLALASKPETRNFICGNICLPLLVITISVPSLWNFSQSSLPSNVTLGSSTTPSSSGW